MSRTDILDNADIVIIGAGIMGTSIAFQLTKNSSHKVLLLDQFQPVGGMSGRTFGQIRQHYSNELMVSMSIRGFEVFKHWENEVGFGDPGYRQMGYLLLVIQEQMKVLQRNVELGQGLGVKTSVVGPDEIARLEPSLTTDDLAGGAYEPEGGYIDVTRMLLSWLVAAQSRGLTLRCGVRATEIEQKGGRVSGVRTSHGLIKAPLVVNATGAWGCDLLGPLGIDVPIKRIRLDMAYLRPQESSAQHDPQHQKARAPISSCITDGNSNVVIRPDMGRDILAVAYAKNLPEIDNPLQAAPQAELVGHTERLEQAFKERLPGYLGARVLREVSGAYDVTPDFHPVLGWAEKIEGLYLAMGFSGHGLKLSPAVGEIVSDALLDKQPVFDVSPLRLSRFRENELMFLAYGANSARA